MGDLNSEPSMEEILASIKRVIAEDGRAIVAPRTGRRSQSPFQSSIEPEGADAAEEDVLELSDPVTDESSLISEGTANASRQSLAALAALSSGPASPPQPAIADGALEAVVRDMLRPMLKDWLDQRLPDMVEDLVTREIARITGKHI